MVALRVAIDATPLLGNPTGVGAFVNGAVGALAARPDVDVRAYALSLRGRRRLASRLPLRVKTVTRPMAAGILLHAWRVADWPPAEWWTGDADVVHGTNFVVPPTRRAAAVVTVHDLTPVRYPQLASPAARRFAQLVRRALRRGAHVHTPSSFVAAEVEELLEVPADRVHAVHHGVPFLPDNGASPMDGRYVLALGTVEPRKDLPSLVHAFDMVAAHDSEVRLVVAGPEGWGSDAFVEAVDRCHHRSRVTRIGYTPPATRAALLRGAAVFAYPSLYEGFGFPPLEAMAAGVPVVASRAGALPEVLGDAALLVPMGDGNALAEAISTVLSDTAVRADLVARGARHVSGFSWAHCATGLVDVYRAAARHR